MSLHLSKCHIVGNLVSRLIIISFLNSNRSESTKNQLLMPVTKAECLKEQNLNIFLQLPEI